AFNFVELLFDAVNDAESVLAVAHDDDSAHNFTLGVQFRDATADVRTEMDRADVLHINGRAVLGFKRHVLDVFDAFDVAAPAHVVFGGGNFENLSANIAIRHADFVDDFIERDAVGEEFVWVHVHLVLLHKAANGGDFRNAFDRFEGVAEM